MVASLLKTSPCSWLSGSALSDLVTSLLRPSTSTAPSKSDLSCLLQESKEGSQEQGRVLQLL